MLRRLVLLCACMAFFGAVGVSSVAPVSAEQITIVNVSDDPFLALDGPDAIKTARGMIAEGKTDVAIGHLESYVTQYPERIDVRRFLGDLYVRTGQVDRAKLVYLQILLIAPHDKETHNRLGTVYAVENQVDSAIAQFSAALPGTDSVQDLVSLHQRRGDIDEYREQVEKWVQNTPSDPGLLGELGQVYTAIRQPAMAVKYFLRALDVDPQNLSAINGLGLAYLDLEDYPNAVAQFKHCLMIDPTIYSCADNLGATQLEMGDLQSAKTTLDRAYALEPERGETFVNYGYLADMQGQWQNAVTQYARAIATWPYLREAYIDLALVYEDHHLYSLAQEALVKGIASVHDDGRMHFLLGRAYELQGDRSDALAQFKLAAAGSDPTAERIGAQRFAELTAGATTKPQ